MPTIDHCVRCQYPKSSERQPVCPECGGEWNADSMRRFDDSLMERVELSLWWVGVVVLISMMIWAVWWSENWDRMQRYSALAGVSLVVSMGLHLAALGVCGGLWLAGRGLRRRRSPRASVLMCWLWQLVPLAAVVMVLGFAVFGD